MTFHRTKPKIADAAVAAPVLVHGFSVVSPSQISHAADHDRTVGTQNSRGRVFLTIAELCGIPVDRVASSDPRIPALLAYDAWAIDLIRARYGAMRLGPQAQWETSMHIQSIAYGQHPP
jgi:hypothetical protein